MGASAQYPMWLGRAFAYAFEVLRKGHLANSHSKEMTFVHKLVAHLPPAGTLSQEDT